MSEMKRGPVVQTLKGETFTPVAYLLLLKIILLNFIHLLTFALMYLTDIHESIQPHQCLTY